jgi:hypothetical protein
LEGKLANGMTTPKPKRQALPNVSISEDEIDRQDI